MNKVLYMVAFVKDEIKSSIELSTTLTTRSFNPQVNTAWVQSFFNPESNLAKIFAPPPPPAPPTPLPPSKNEVDPQWLCTELLFTYLPLIMVSQTLRHGYLLKPFRIYFKLCMCDDGCEMDGKWITRCLAWFPLSFTLALCLFVTHFFFFFSFYLFYFPNAGKY